MTVTILNDRLMDHPEGRNLRAFDLAPHGGRLIEARRLFPTAPEPFIDLSTGINPLSYPIPPITPSAWTRLPEPEAIARLEAAAAKAYGVADGSMVASVPGTQLQISLLPRLFPHDSVAILGPTYSEYARSFAPAGSRVTEVSALHELDAAPCAILCNPNNPDGRRFEADTLLALARKRAGNRLLVVDESFADLEGEGLSLAPHLPQPGLLVLRSLSKGYGLGGVRLGFALADPEFAASIRAALGPWPVSGPAIEIGANALADRGWLEAAKQQLTQDVTRLDGMLRGAGMTVIGGTRLFRLAEYAEAASLYQRLGEAGILVRSFSYRPDWLRFGIPGSEEEWRRLADALRSSAAA
jgi:cobalamin biosynthetic protein CobC